MLDDIEADIGEDQPPDVFLQLTLFIDLDRRNTQRLLPDFLGVGIVAAAHIAADIGLMTFHRHPANQRLTVKYRLIDRHVIVLVAERKDVVVEYDIAGMDIVAEEVLDVFAHRRQREGEDRQVFGLLQHVAVGVVEPGDEILRFAQDRRTRRHLDRQAHLVGDRLEQPRVNRSQNGIDGGHLPSPSLSDVTRPSRPLAYRMKEPSGSTTQSKSRLTKIAVVVASIIAGPVIRLPGVSKAPSKIGAAAKPLSSGI